MNLTALAICVFLAAAARGSGQDLAERSPWFVRGGFVASRVLPSQPFLTGDNAAAQPILFTPSLTIEIGRQTDGRRRWHHLYGLPAYGVGFSMASFGDNQELGRPLEAYAFFSWPFARLNDHLDLTTDFSMGASWHWHKFNEKTNPFNNVIGSDLNFRFDWGFYLRHKITPRISLYGGLDFTHRSNGELLEPNDGINVIGPRVMMRYNFADEAHELPVEAPLPPFVPAWELVIGGTGSHKHFLQNLQPLVQSDFNAFNATLGAQRHFYYYGKLGGGADVTYDGITGAHTDIVNGVRVTSRADASDRWALGLYGGYEHVIARFSVIGQVGYIVARASQAEDAARVYERYGWRYRVSDRVWAQMTMRLIEGFNATHVEFGGGYRLRWHQRDDQVTR